MTPDRIDSLRKGADQHKFSHGSALVLTGPATRTGAARLAARAALRVGAGLVTLGAPREALPECAAQISALMLREVSEPLDLTLMLADDPRINVICLGPGFGLERAQTDMLRTVLNCGTPCVLDADALTLIAQDRDLATLLHKDCVLTPHAGEFRRLFPGLGEDREAFSDDEKKDAAWRAAEQTGAVVLYKGALTTVANPDGVHSLDTRDRPYCAWLATAGAGDVLAGMIAGLMARGLRPLEAAQTGAALHSMAADALGPGLIAEDLPEALPRVFKGLDL